MRPMLDAFIDQNNLHRTEGEQGIINLCQIAYALGYNDPMYFGQLTHKAKVGDLLEFLKDNSGCVEAIIDWIRENEHLWADQLVDQVECEDEDEEDSE